MDLSELLELVFICVGNWRYQIRCYYVSDKCVNVLSLVPYVKSCQCKDFIEHIINVIIKVYNVKILLNL